jgi:hypothetical protein
MFSYLYSNNNNYINSSANVNVILIIVIISCSSLHLTAITGETNCNELLYEYIESACYLVVCRNSLIFYFAGVYLATPCGLLSTQVNTGIRMEMNETELVTSPCSLNVRT